MRARTRCWLSLVVNPEQKLSEVDVGQRPAPVLSAYKALFGLDLCPFTPDFYLVLFLSVAIFLLTAGPLTVMTLS